MRVGSPHGKNELTKQMKEKQIQIPLLGSRVAKAQNT